MSSLPTSRTETITFRCTPQVESMLQAIALARDTTLSDLVFQTVLELVERERKAFRCLSRAFGVDGGIPPEDAT